ncbi:Terminase, large subunit [Pseudomonas savastanoi pv. retacarpa]|nr:terminase, large subunit [Pseudomonas amygdali pv. lachrymans str. M302278]KPY49253.1 Terminase, large subunit [Pseudomonas savastanoi pv. retacarpa]
MKGKAERNEALDLLVYSLAMANYLGLHRYGEHDWGRLKNALAQAGLFDDTGHAKAPVAERLSVEAKPEPKPEPRPQPVAAAVQAPARPAPQPPQRRASTSGYLKRR